MLSFEVAGTEAGKRVVEACEVINLAVSLGGVESLVEHPSSMTHTRVLWSPPRNDAPQVLPTASSASPLGWKTSTTFELIWTGPSALLVEVTG